MEIIYKKVQELIPYLNNSRTHSEEQVNQICASINEFGFTNPVLIDEKDMIIAGHGRLLASKKLGMEEVPCIVLEGLTEAQKKAYIIADNKMALNAGWDEELLKIEIENLKELDFDMELTGFSVDELDDILGFDEEEKEVEEDDFEVEVPEEPKAKLGDIYQLGNHRLMCGDSTNEEDVKKLMGGEKVDLLITDPPYNVEIVGGNHSESPAERKKKGNLTIANDKMDNDSFHQFLYDVFTNAYSVLKDGASFYVWYASREVVNFQTSIEESGLTVKQELIWNKNSLVMGRQDYQWKHEPCLYGWKETDSHKWYGDRKQTTVIDWDRPTRSDLHPTMKPIGLFDYQIKNSSKIGDNVLDLFGGSGTTIMACEQNGRKGYSMEFDPRYVDVIINRWEQYTGKKAILIETDNSSSN